MISLITHEEDTRSQDRYRVVCACVRAGFAIGFGAMIQWPPSHPVRHRHVILCVGWSHNDRYLRLEFDGYKFIEVNPEDAPALLAQQVFSLVILAHDVPDSCFSEIYMAANDKSKIVQLGQLTP